MGEHNTAWSGEYIFIPLNGHWNVMLRFWKQNGKLTIPVTGRVDCVCGWVVAKLSIWGLAITTVVVVERRVRVGKGGLQIWEMSVAGFNPPATEKRIIITKAIAFFAFPVVLLRATCGRIIRNFSECHVWHQFASELYQILCLFVGFHAFNDMVVLTSDHMFMMQNLNCL